MTNVATGTQKIAGKVFIDESYETLENPVFEVGLQIGKRLAS